MSLEISVLPKNDKRYLQQYSASTEKNQPCSLQFK